MMRWKLQPRETGLRAVGAGPQKSDLRIDGDEVATVIPSGGGWRGPVTGWYFVARHDERGIPLRNTCGEPVATEEEAKAQAVAYVKSCLAAKTAS